MSQKYSSKIIEKEIVAENTLKVSFERPDNFSFQAGQHIQLAVEKLHHSDPKGSSRVFSICSSPLDTDRISVVFRNTGSGFKKTLSELSIGSVVLIEGPFGFFTLPKSGNDKHVFVAGGIGIAPFKSMITESMASDYKSSIHLIYANKNKSCTTFINELTELIKKSDIFSFDLIYGRVEKQHVLHYVNQNTQDINWWIAGPPEMVADTKYIIESLGVWDNKIHTEEFIGY